MVVKLIPKMVFGFSESLKQSKAFSMLSSFLNIIHLQAALAEAIRTAPSIRELLIL